MAIDIGPFPTGIRETTSLARRREGSSGSVMPLVLLVMAILLLGLALLSMGERGRIQAMRISSILTARAARMQA